MLFRSANEATDAFWLGCLISRSIPVLSCTYVDLLRRSSPTCGYPTPHAWLYNAAGGGLCYPGSWQCGPYGQGRVSRSPCFPLFHRFVSSVCFFCLVLFSSCLFSVVSPCFCVSFLCDLQRCCRRPCRWCYGGAVVSSGRSAAGLVGGSLCTFSVWIIDIGLVCRNLICIYFSIKI